MDEIKLSCMPVVALINRTGSCPLVGDGVKPAVLPLPTKVQIRHSSKVSPAYYLLKPRPH